MSVSLPNRNQELSCCNATHRSRLRALKTPKQLFCCNYRPRIFIFQPLLLSVKKTPTSQHEAPLTISSSWWNGGFHFWKFTKSRKMWISVAPTRQYWQLVTMWSNRATWQHEVKYIEACRRPNKHISRSRQILKGHRVESWNPRLHFFNWIRTKTLFF